MKKTFSTLLLLICVIAANAQKAKSNGVANNLSIGPIVGVNFSTLRGNDNNSFKTGFSGGLFANYSILDNFGITAQVLYSTQGAKSKSNSNDVIKVNYFQVPVLLMFYFNKPGSAFRPKVIVGPQFGFLSSAKTTIGSATVDTKDYYTTSDVSGTIGLGFNYSVGKGIWLNMDARYAHGFTDISSGSNILLVPKNTNNSVISVMAGVSFAFGNYEDL